MFLAVESGKSKIKLLVDPVSNGVPLSSWFAEEHLIVSSPGRKGEGAGSFLPLVTGALILS